METSRQSLVEAIENNPRDTFIDLSRLTRTAEIFEIGQTVGYMTDIKFPMFNGTVRPRFDSAGVDDGIDGFLGRARERGVPMLWWVTPSSRPLDLTSRLVDRGFVIDRLPGMALDLSSIRPERPPQGVEIRRVRGESDLVAALDVCCRCFDMPSFVQEPFRRMISVDGLGEMAGFHTYLAELEGTPIATSGVAYKAGVAGIYNVATLPEGRGRGIGRAITLAPLLDARRRGVRIGILHSTRQGYSVYNRLGFEHVCDIDSCVWLPD
jgi:GNAT superfamily N-acetyltransferase